MQEYTQWVSKVPVKLPASICMAAVVQCREQQLEVTLLAIAKPILWINRGFECCHSGTGSEKRENTKCFHPLLPAYFPKIGLDSVSFVWRFLVI